jgi:hypothetical protein
LSRPFSALLSSTGTVSIFPIVAASAAIEALF